MVKNLLAYSQYLLPQHALSQLMGLLAESHHEGVKNFLIKQFMRRYPVDMTSAVIEDPTAYPTFNSFFIRQLKPGLRPIATDDIASPVDGTIAQIGQINKHLLLQAKDFYFDLKTLLGNDETLAQDFYDGSFATFYLAPHNYHRIHMPLSGKLEKMIYVPGKLFSVNRITSQVVPNLYSRNERLVCTFNTAASKMVVVMIAAMIVGQIQTTWLPCPIRGKEMQSFSYVDENIVLGKGDELGYFKTGSTVIVLFQKNKVKWSPEMLPGESVVFGGPLGSIRS
jgi:phosphatidylserine decarboxylase